MSNEENCSYKCNKRKRAKLKDQKDEIMENDVESTKTEDVGTANVLNRFHEELPKTEENDELEAVTNSNTSKIGNNSLPNSKEINEVSLRDIQKIILNAVAGDNSPFAAEQLCGSLKTENISQTVVLVVNGLSAFHYFAHEKDFEKTNEIFQEKFGFDSPTCTSFCAIRDLALIPLSFQDSQELISEYGNIKKAINSSKNTLSCLEKNMTTTDMNQNLPINDRFSRTDLLLSCLQMVEQDYPLPYRENFTNAYDDYLKTAEKYTPVTDHSPIFSIDCEMCQTVGGKHELTRISVVNEDLECIYDSLVLPSRKIINYLTPYSGITPEIMEKATKTLAIVQKDIQNLLPPDAIIAGHSLNMDLHAMKMMHPYVVDTSVVYNVSGVGKLKPKLQTLAKMFLDEEIQKNKGGHDSIEDSRICLKLVKLKLLHDINFGDATKSNTAYNIIGYASNKGYNTAIVTSNPMKLEIPALSAFNFRNMQELLNCKSNEKNKRNIDYFELTSNKSTTKKIKEISSLYSFIITNLNINEEWLEMSSIEKTVSNVNKWINRVWKRIRQNGLLIVVLTGTPDAPNGLALISLKKDKNNSSNS